MIRIQKVFVYNPPIRVYNNSMSITLNIPPETEKELRELSECEKLSVEDIVADMVRRRLAAKRFREACRVVEPFAKAAGFTSEEQILESFS